MKKNVIVFHGTGGTPEHFWFPYVKKSLSAEKYNVCIPRLPNTDKPDIDKWLPFVLNKYTYNEKTILVGHSAGCPLILSILENIENVIYKAILVAGFHIPLTDDPEPILQNKYDWEKIKQHAKKFWFINSVNDPWGCNDKQGRFMFDKLGGDMIIRDDQGHMGSTAFNQPYKEFPLVKFLIES